jgi:hypothetical protein
VAAEVVPQVFDAVEFRGVRGHGISVTFAAR